MILLSSANFCLFSVAKITAIPGRHYVCLQDISLGFNEASADIECQHYANDQLLWDLIWKTIEMLIWKTNLLFSYKIIGHNFKEKYAASY